ncbi:MAG TPA: hypothetical protein VIQ54_12885, partial [Polyangia bacterium]
GGSGGASVGGDVGDRNDLDVGALPVSGGVPLVHDESVADYGSAQLLHKNTCINASFDGPVK